MHALLQDDDHSFRDRDRDRDRVGGGRILPGDQAPVFHHEVLEHPAGLEPATGLAQTAFQ